MARRETLGGDIIDGAVGGGLFGANLKVGAGVLDAEVAINPPQRNLANAMIAASLAGGAAVLVDEYRSSGD